MIKVKKLNGTEIVINAELIENIEGSSNAVITLTTGNKIIVQDTLDIVVEKVIEYKRKIKG